MPKIQVPKSEFRVPSSKIQVPSSKLRVPSSEFQVPTPKFRSSSFLCRQMKYTNWLKWPIFILLCFIWGSAFILMKSSRDGLTGVQIGGLRIFSAGLVCLPFLISHRRHFPAKKMWLLFATGLCGNLLPAFLFALAVTRIDSSLAGILNSLTPLVVICLAVWFFRDRFAGRKVVGVLLGFAGLCLLTFTQDNLNLGNLGFASLVLLATIFYGLNVNLVAHFLKGYPSAAITTVSLSMMVIPAFTILAFTGFFSLDFQDNVIQWAVLNTVVLGIAGSAIGTALFYLLVQQAGGLFASLVTYGIPFIALFWGFLDGEKITPVTIVSLVIILAGVFLANKKTG